ncbi:hypothetical protein [Saliphagus infecundisoli]|uniref:PRC-barrel domain containing protein n=1 Tax=Saliphagus infecundisoli TaxID=1849069 RepID=A0ABD5QGL9_9EURY|nr:hypothetical protein [Saliphagus infecundisoli]
MVDQAAMCATFTDDDVGKTVVNASGDEIGIVSAIEHGTARVEPDPGITDTIRAKLGWEDTNEETYPLQDHAVSRVTDDEVRLEQDLAGASGAAGTGPGTSGVGDDAGIGNDSGLTDDDDDLLGDDDTRRNDDDDDSLL